jgi:hypothetical protein
MSRSAPIRTSVAVYWAIWVFLEEENAAASSAAVTEREGTPPRRMTASKSGSTQVSHRRFTHAISLKFGRLVGL